MKKTDKSAGSRSSDKARSGPLGVELIPDSAILIQARVKVSEPQLRFEEVANLLMHDPVLTMEFLHFANSVVFAGAGKVQSPETAVSRLGTKRILNTLNDLNSRRSEESEEVEEWFEALRYNCRRTSIVAMIIATATWPDLKEAARTSALFCDVGHMVALLFLGKKYIEKANNFRRKTLAYRLQKDYNFNVDDVLVRYLHSKGIPELLTLPYEPQRECKMASEANLRFIVQSAQELVEAFDSAKLDTFAPEKGLPTRSAFRLLGVTPPQHQRLFPACEMYLKHVAKEEAPESASLLLVSLDQDKEDGNQELDSMRATPTGTLTKPIAVPKYPAPSVKAKSRKRLQDLYQLCMESASEDSLKKEVVGYVTKNDLYSRAALVRLRPEDDKAVVEHAAGGEILQGAKISIDDPLSPFNLFSLRVQSFRGSQEDVNSPFGVSAYAIGPADLTPDGEKILLYVDCKDAEMLSMEMRRVFRMLLNLISNSLDNIRTYGDDFDDEDWEDDE